MTARGTKQQGTKQQGAERKAWTKLEIKRLGRLSDVSGAQGAGVQSAGLKT